jgi:Fur family ferric uptake transcriptional regulator
MDRRESEDRLSAILRERGLRLTPQRELVLRAVEALRHATPDQVYAEVRSRSEAVNLSTVYRTLELLDDLGLIRHAHLGDRAPTYHAVTDHEHFHLVCRECGRVESKDRAAAGPLLKHLEVEDGFQVDVGHLTVFGTCRECAAGSSPSGPGATPPT